MTHSALIPKSTILILYPPGGYGTFLHWCMEYFSTGEPNYLPFRIDGSSHNFTGLRVDDHDKGQVDVEDYLRGSREHRVIRSHGRFDRDNGFYKPYVDSVIDFFSKIILLQPSANDRLLILQNRLTKTRNENIVSFYDRIKSIYSQRFGVTDKEVPRWQLREMISYWFELHTHLEQVYDNLVHEKIVRISIRKLVDNFSCTLKNLFADLDLKMVNSHDILNIQNQWLSLQKFAHSDALCREIIAKTINNIDYEWPMNRLSLIEEAYIQFDLRTVYNRDLICYNLDLFPNSTRDLQKILIECQ